MWKWWDEIPDYNKSMSYNEMLANWILSPQVVCLVCKTPHPMATACRVCSSWREESSLSDNERVRLILMLYNTLGYTPEVKEKPGGETI